MNIVTPSMMHAVCITDEGLKYSASHPVPTAAGDEIVLKLLRAGICETDLQIVKGYMGFRGVLGHEFVATALTGRYRGQRVVGEINCPCHRCEFCKKGLGNHCPQRSVLGILGRDGAFADYLALPEANLHRVPDQVSDDHAVFTEPLAAAFQIPAQIDLSSHRRVAVVGDGRLGYLCAQVLKLFGCDVSVIGKHNSKLQRFANVGIKTFHRDEQPSQRTMSLVVDCTGSAQGIHTAMQWLKPRGIYVLKTTVGDPHGPNLAPIVIDEITVIGSRCGPFVPALQALKDDMIEVASLITARYPLADALHAFTAAASGQHSKVLFHPSN